MRVTRRLLIGIVAIAAGQRGSASSTGTAISSDLPHGDRAPQKSTVNTPSSAEIKAASGDVHKKVMDAPQTLQSLQLLLPKLRVDLIKGALDSLVDQDEVETWTTKDQTAFYMDFYKLSLASDTVVAKTTDKGVRLSALKASVPKMTPPVVAAIVAYLTEEGRLKELEGGTADDPLIASTPKNTHHGG